MKNPSAFPNAPIYGLQEEDGIYELLVDEQSLGMTLRDYFAAKALSNAYTQHHGNPDKVAEWAYEVADAMLAAREEE